MNLPTKVYMVDIYGNGTDIKFYKGKQGWSYFKRYNVAKFYIGEIYNWEDVTDQVKGVNDDPNR